VIGLSNGPKVGGCVSRHAPARERPHTPSHAPPSASFGFSGPK
jgi:hypothetical protein